MHARLRSAAPFIAAIAFASFPVAAFAAAPRAHVTHGTTLQIAGLYNLTLGGEKGGAQQRVDLILERTERGLDALLLSEANAVTLSDVTFDGKTFRASAVTSVGRGALVLVMTDDGLTGTLTVATHRIAVKGQRAQ
ncbi:MAG: hypothetical protein ABJE47_14565 [bacterium]